MTGQDLVAVAACVVFIVLAELLIRAARRRLLPVVYDATELGWCSNDPGNPPAVEAWFVRSRWERGMCPCCGLLPATAGTSAIALAEGMRLCRFCSRPEHCPGDPGRAGLLRALASAPAHCPG